PANGSDPCLLSPYCADAFVTRLSPGGSSLVYSTYLGGKRWDWANGVAVDAAGNAYVMGQTNSDNFPTLNAVQPTYGGGWRNHGSLYYDCNDAFVTKLSADGSSLVYSTYLGGNRDEGYSAQRGGIAVDPGGHAYVTGETESGNFPIFNAIQ